MRKKAHRRCSDILLTRGELYEHVLSWENIRPPNTRPLHILVPEAAIESFEDMGHDQFRCYGSIKPAGAMIIFRHFILA